MEGLVIKDAVFDLIINIINIVILFVIVKLLVYKPVKKFLNDRNERIKEAKAEADNLMAEAEQTKQNYDELKKNLENENDLLITKTKQKAMDNAEKIIAEARLQAKEIIELAKSEAEKEREAILGTMKKDINIMAFEIAEKILDREVTDRDNMLIADKFFSAEGKN